MAASRLSLRRQLVGYVSTHAASSSNEVSHPILSERFLYAWLIFFSHKALHDQNVALYLMDKYNNAQKVGAYKDAIDNFFSALSSTSPSPAPADLIQACD
jgi:hypothetical protein